MNSKQNDQEVALLIFQLMKALEDRSIDAKEGALLCQGAIKLITKVRGQLPRLWQRFLMDTAISALEEAAKYLQSVENGN
tara:strand:- start:75 stop:314 length:240 start_codon:yes stop_codon:yes gene_type:complete